MKAGRTVENILELAGFKNIKSKVIEFVLLGGRHICLPLVPSFFMRLEDC